MDLHLSEEHQVLVDSFREIFSNESSCERVRAAEPLGHDPALWQTLIESDAIGMRAAQSRGGAGASLLDAALIAEQAGRHLASVPLVEGVVVGSLLSGLSGSDVDSWLARTVSGERIMSLALFEGPAPQLVPGGAVADAVVGLDGDQLVLVREGARAPHPGNLGSSPVARFSLGGERTVLVHGEEAVRAYRAAREEWKLLMSACLAGLGRRALEMAADYAGERVQFDRLIGTFQGVAHPLADSVTAVEGARMLVWRAIWAIAAGRADAAALVSAAFTFSAESTSTAVARALHTFGGYGLSMEYDIQLYNRRGKAWALLAGDPSDELQRMAERSWDGADVPLPQAGDIGIEFGLGDRAEAFRPVVRRFFEEHLTDELRAFARYDWDGHHPAFHKLLTEKSLAFASWPKAYGGQGRGPYEMAVLKEEFHRVGWAYHPISTTSMIGETLLRYASDELKAEVIPRICSGDVVASMGYSEPGSGSDVAAAQTRAVRDGADWVIDGQKMFTSGANVAQYVFLLTRTDPEAPKHRGLTMFLVPLDLPGIEVQPIHTIGDERTNASYYTGVRVSDRCRVGEVNGGWAVVAYALELEHGGGGTGGFYDEHLEVVAHAVDWARNTRREGMRVLDDPRARERLARARVRAEVAQTLGLHALWAGVEGVATHGEGPMAKLFGAESLVEDSADLLALAAPDSILTSGAEGAAADGQLEHFYRLATATRIYGGTSEIMRSIIAQAALGMPRSRS